MKKLIISLFLSVALIGGTSVMAQTPAKKEVKKEATKKEVKATTKKEAKADTAKKATTTKATAKKAVKK